MLSRHHTTCKHRRILRDPIRQRNSGSSEKPCLYQMWILRSGHWRYSECVLLECSSNRRYWYNRQRGTVHLRSVSRPVPRFHPSRRHLQSSRSECLCKENMPVHRTNTHYQLPRHRHCSHSNQKQSSQVRLQSRVGTHPESWTNRSYHYRILSRMSRWRDMQSAYIRFHRTHLSVLHTSHRRQEWLNYRHRLGLWPSRS